MRELIARWKSIFTDETTKVGVTDYVKPFNIELEPGTKPENQAPHPSPGRNLEKTTGRLGSRWYNCPLSQCMGLTLGPGVGAVPLFKQEKLSNRRNKFQQECKILKTLALKI